jgi:hypothetical protein
MLNQLLPESAAAEVFVTEQIWFVVTAAELLYLLRLMLWNLFDLLKIFICKELYWASFQIKGLLICSYSWHH